MTAPLPSAASSFKQQYENPMTAAAWGQGRSGANAVLNPVPANLLICWQEWQGSNLRPPVLEIDVPADDLL